MIWTQLLALIATIILEYFVVIAFLRKDYTKLLGYAVLINCFTLPLATLLAGRLPPSSLLLGWLGIEIGIVLVESVLWLLLLNQKYGKMLLMSLVANALTAIIGLMVMSI